jgi:hypothetical protein
MLSVGDKPLPIGSPLRAAQGSADGLRFEVYWANLPPEAEAGDQANLWRFVQEERLDGALRVRLRRNGLRAGIVGGVPPQEIVSLLDPRPGRANGANGADSDDETVTRLDAPTGVTKQEMTVRPGEPAQVNASEVVPAATLLLADEKGPWGESFDRVQGVYRVGVERQTGGGWTVSLSPELHHGEPRMRWASDGSGVITRPKATRDERPFPELRIEAPLVVGEMLVVTSLPDCDSRLGGFFHRADSDAPGVRKAIVVRLVQTPAEAAFGESDP